MKLYSKKRENGHKRYESDEKRDISVGSNRRLKSHTLMLLMLSILRHCMLIDLDFINFQF